MTKQDKHLFYLETQVSALKDLLEFYAKLLQECVGRVEEIVLQEIIVDINMAKARLIDLEKAINNYKLIKNF